MLHTMPRKNVTLRKTKPRSKLHCVWQRSGAWPRTVQWYEKNLQQMIAAWAAQEKSTIVSMTINMVLSDAKTVHQLNKRFRHKDKPTNVLTFVHDEVAEADVILAHEVIAQEAHEQGKLFKHHALHMMLHGVLHAVGYDHQTSQQANVMERLETQLLSLLNIASPYAACHIKADKDET